MADPDAIRVLARQALRWLTAARQDREPAVAVLHADYARAAVDHLRQIAPDDEIRRVAGVDPIRLERTTTAVQDEVTARLLARCPALRPRGLDGVGTGRRREIAAIVTIGVGASALANVVTRHLADRRGLWPAVAAGLAITGAGIYLAATEAA